MRKNKAFHIGDGITPPLREKHLVERSLYRVVVLARTQTEYGYNRIV